MPDGMIQKERKKRIIKQAAMKAILVIILVCIAMITFLLLFQVRKIEVLGNQYLSRQEIADWVQDDNWSSNSLYVMIRNHLMNHELLPAMEKANVAKVTVDRYVHPGTCISVNGMKTQVQELEQHVEYARRGNGIIVYHIDEA